MWCSNRTIFVVLEWKTTLNALEAEAIDTRHWVCKGNNYDRIQKSNTAGFVCKRLESADVVDRRRISSFLIWHIELLFFVILCVYACVLFLFTGIIFIWQAISSNFRFKSEERFRHIRFVVFYLSLHAAARQKWLIVYERIFVHWIDPAGLAHFYVMFYFTRARFSSFRLYLPFMLCVYFLQRQRFVHNQFNRTKRTLNGLNSNSARNREI